jgi:hypothetical protein
MKNRLEKQWKSGPVWSQNFRQNITEGDRNIPMALKILSKNGPLKSEGQGNIASEK